MIYGLCSWCLVCSSPGRSSLASALTWTVTSNQIGSRLISHVSQSFIHVTKKHIRKPALFYSVAMEQLCVNVTTSLLTLIRNTQASWQRDLQENRERQQQILSLHQQSKIPGKDGGEWPVSQQPSVQKGLALLHSVRFVSQSRQRAQFVPFVLRNSTGLKLRFCTMTSLPAKVFSPSSLLQQSVGIMATSTMESSSNSLLWMEVAPGKEQPFDFTSRQKLRHKVQTVAGLQWISECCNPSLFIFV